MDSIHFQKEVLPVEDRWWYLIEKQKIVWEKSVQIGAEKLTVNNIN